MSQYVTEAILLAVRNWGEADRMVTLFSREYGKVAAIAYGCRRPQNRLAGGMQIFSHVELSLMPGKGLDTVKQCEVKHSFRKIRENLNCMAYASFLAELVIEFCPERQAEPHTYDLLLGALTTITERNPRLVALAAAWQLLSIAGYYPEYKQCVTCGQSLGEAAYFSAELGGGVCTNCDHQNLPEFSAVAAGFIENLLHIDWENPNRFTVNGNILVQTENILIRYLVCLLEKPLKSLEFIKQIATAIEPKKPDKAGI